MKENFPESDNTEHALHELPQIDGRHFADFLASDDSALAAAIRSVIHRMEATEQNYAEFGNAP